MNAGVSPPTGGATSACPTTKPPDARPSRLVQLTVADGQVASGDRLRLLIGREISIRHQRHVEMTQVVCLPPARANSIQRQRLRIDLGQRAA
jgi:hypothetical protein